jgi:hypothetical protein
MFRKIRSKTGRLARLTDRYPLCSFYSIVIGIIISGIWALSVLYSWVPATRPFIFLLKTPYRLAASVYRETKMLQETDDLQEQRNQLLRKSSKTSADSLFLRDYPMRMEQIAKQNF